MKEDQVELGVLGEVEVRLHGERVDVGHARQRSVLGVLLIDANRVVSTDRLVDRTWGEQPPNSARSALRTYLSHLRQALAPTGVTITRQHNGYVLATAADAVDLHRFHRLLSAARKETDPHRALALADDALRLWRGEPLTELDTPWAQTVRQTLRQERFAAQVDRVDWALRSGKDVELLADLTALAVSHPLDERLASQLMLALYRSGRQADALAQYDRVRRQLAEELGADPSPPVRKLHERILRADPDLLPTPESRPLPVGRSPVPPAAPTTPAPISPDAPGPRRRRGRGATIAVLTSVAGIVLVASGSRDGATPPRHHSSSSTAQAPASPPALPAPGGYHVRLAHSKLCLSEAPTDDSGRVYQRDCGRSIPAMTLQHVHGDVYRVLTHHTEFGDGCMGIPGASTNAGAAVYDGFCGTGAAEEFQLVPNGGSGFRIRAVHSMLCLGVLEVSMTEWAPIFQMPCDPSGAGQTFTFEPRR